MITLLFVLSLNLFFLRKIVVVVVVSDSSDMVLQIV